MAPGEDQVKFTVEIVEAQPRALGQGVAFAISTVETLIRAKAGEVNGNHKLDGGRRHFLPNPLRSRSESSRDIRVHAPRRSATLRRRRRDHD